jgi:hypothetical protein
MVVGALTTTSVFDLIFISRYFLFVLSCNPVYVRHVDSSTLGFSISLHRLYLSLSRFIINNCINSPDPFGSGETILFLVSGDMSETSPHRTPYTCFCRGCARIWCLTCTSFLLCRLSDGNLTFYWHSKKLEE